MTVVWYQACIVSAVFDRHVLALDIARVLQIPQSVAERFRRLAAKDTDDRHRHLLRARATSGQGAAVRAIPAMKSRPTQSRVSMRS